MTRKLDLDKHDATARAAEQDEWRWRGGVLEGVNDGAVVLWVPEGNDGTDEPVLIVSTSNAAHIAANSPPVTLALTERIRRLEAALGSAIGELEDTGGEYARGVTGELASILEEGVVVP